jgi:signal transduction histidine kinase
LQIGHTLAPFDAEVKRLELILAIGFPIALGLIAVQDTGIGIAPNEQTRIFERFYRVDSDRARTTGGTGLGLAIVHAIVHRHHGQIVVQSELGSGSLFTIQLPCHHWMNTSKSDR